MKSERIDCGKESLVNPYKTGGKKGEKGKLVP
jgi:hypothetical protein